MISMLLMVVGSVSSSPSCTPVIQGKAIRFCASPTWNPHDILTFLANRGYPLAVFLAQEGDTFRVDEGPFVVVNTLAVIPSNRWLQRWLEGALLHRPFSLRHYQTIASWLNRRGHAPFLSWSGTLPVVRWHTPPPRGSLVFQWNQRLLGGGELEVFFPSFWTYLQIETEGYQTRQSLDFTAERPIQPGMDLYVQGRYTDALLPQSHIEGGIGLSFSMVSLRAGMGFTSDTMVQIGASVFGLFHIPKIPEGTFTFQGRFRPRGWMLRLESISQFHWWEVQSLIADGTLPDPDGVLPRGGWQTLHGWPETGFWNRGWFVRLGIGPHAIRVVGEGLFENTPPLWSVGFRMMIKPYVLWMMWGVPGGRAWVYLTLQLA